MSRLLLYPQLGMYIHAVAASRELRAARSLGQNVPEIAEENCENNQYWASHDENSHSDRE